MALSELENIAGQVQISKDFDHVLRDDNIQLLSALSWAVGSLEGTGHDGGYARRVLDRFLQENFNAPDERMKPDAPEVAEGTTAQPVLTKEQLDRLLSIPSDIHGRER